MELYYMNSIMINIVSLLIMIISCKNSKLLSLGKRNCFISAFALVILIAIAESLSFFQGNEMLDHHTFVIWSGFIKPTLFPVIPVALGAAVGNISHVRWMAIPLLLNGILQFISIWTGWMFFVGTDHIWYPGPLYWFYLLICLAGILFLYLETFHQKRNIQTRNKPQMILIFLFLIIGAIVQHFVTSLQITCHYMAVVTILYYILYLEMYQNIEPLTTLLNRLCYENQLASLHKNAVVIMMDVNDFKQINDTYGHLFGDEILATVSDCIKKVYAPYGDCYRIGGDEFCVLLYQKQEEVETLNKQFQNLLSSCRRQDNRLPYVSIGHECFRYGNGNILTTIESADRNMYENKEKQKEEQE